MSGANVWLGVAGDELPPGTEVDAYASRVGGTPSWLRPRADNGPVCGSCSAPLALLTQLHAPLAVFDRILYVFACLTCCKGGNNSAVVLRSQVYNPDYDTDLQERIARASEPAPAPKVATIVVEGADDWGDDAPVAAAPAPPPVAVPPVDVSPMFAFAPPVSPAAKLPKKALLRCYALDTIAEPRGAKQAAATAEEEVLAELENRNPDVIDREAGGDDATEDEDDSMDEFVERMGRAPRQCVRWEPNGVPLRAYRDAPCGPAPRCPSCGAARQFEFQVVSPLIYFVCNGMSEEQQPLHFTSILVYTCSNHCYSETDHYTTEHAIWHAEI